MVLNVRLSADFGMHQMLKQHSFVYVASGMHIMSSIKKQ